KLSAALAGLPALTIPPDPPGRLHTWHQYTIRLPARALPRDEPRDRALARDQPRDRALARDQLRDRLAARGIESRAYYPRLVHDHPCYRDHPQVIPDETPQARQAVSQVLSLPVHPALTPDDLDRIVSAVRE